MNVTCINVLMKAGWLLDIYFCKIIKTRAKFSLHSGMH